MCVGAHIRFCFPFSWIRLRDLTLCSGRWGVKGGGRKKRTDPRETLNDIILPYKIRCSYDGVEDKRIMGMQLDKASSSLYVAFSTCVIKVPLGRCERHGKCKKYVFASLIIRKSTVLRKES